MFVDPVSVSLLGLVVILNGRSRDSVDPQLLNPQLRPELPESGSAEHRKETQSLGLLNLGRRYNRLGLLASMRG